MHPIRKAAIATCNMVLSNPNTPYTPLNVGIGLELMVVAGLQMGCITFTKRRFSSICITNVHMTHAARLYTIHRIYGRARVVCSPLMRDGQGAEATREVVLVGHD